MGLSPSVAILGQSGQCMGDTLGLSAVSEVFFFFYSYNPTIFVSIHAFVLH